MFLNALTAEQQRIFLQAARAIAEADGAVPEIESALITGLRQECGFDEEVNHVPLSELMPDARATLDSPFARNIFLLELVGVAVVDGELRMSGSSWNFDGDLPGLTVRR